MRPDGSPRNAEFEAGRIRCSLLTITYYGGLKVELACNAEDNLYSPSGQGSSHDVNSCLLVNADFRFRLAQVIWRKLRNTIPTVYPVMKFSQG